MTKLKKVAKIIAASAILFMVVAAPKLFKIDDDLCTQCGVCVEECPQEAIIVEEVEGKLHHYIDAEKCDGCGICVPECPEEAIVPVESAK